MSDDEKEYVLYKHRPEWSDIKPIPQEDGPNSVVQIAYSEKFKDAYDYFRAILAKGEKSERALELTATAIELNAANYTVWELRREILRALNKNVAEEMALLSDIIMSQQKNYQVWHHRRALVEWSKDASEELKFTAEIIQEDQKNYHAWQHRQWVIKEFGKWDEELKYVESLLLIDIRNNSAWNQRHFVIKHTTGLTDDVLLNEIEFTLQKIDKALHNESAWSYLRGLLKSHGLNWSHRVKERVDFWKAENMKSPQFLSFVVDMLAEEIEKGAENADQNMAEAQEVCIELCKVDAVRRKYWSFKLDKMRANYVKLQAA